MNAKSLLVAPLALTLSVAGGQAQTSAASEAPAPPPATRPSPATPEKDLVGVDLSPEQLNVLQDLSRKLPGAGDAEAAAVEEERLRQLADTAARLREAAETPAPPLERGADERSTAVRRTRAELLEEKKMALEEEIQRKKKETAAAMQPLAVQPAATPAKEERKLERALTEARHALREAERQRKKAESLVIKLRDENARLKQEAGAARDALAKLKKDADALRDRQQEMSRQLEDARQRAGRGKSVEGAAGKASVKAARQLDAARVRIKRLEKENATLQEKLAGLEKKLAARKQKGSSTDDARARVKAMQAELRQLKTALAAARDEVQTGEQARRRMAAKVDAATAARVHRINQALERTQKERDAALKKLRTLSGQVHDLRARLAARPGTPAPAAKRTTALRKQNKALSEKLASATRDGDALAAELKSVRAELARTLQRAQQAEREKEALRKQADKLARKLQKVTVRARGRRKVRVTAPKSIVVQGATAEETEGTRQIEKGLTDLQRLLDEIKTDLVTKP